MDIVKKNLISILLGVVAIVCVVLIFFPFGGMYDTLLQNVTASQSTGQKIQSVMNQNRTWPSLSPKEEDKIPLDQFPTPAIIAKGEQMTTTWTKQKDDALAYVINLQQSQLEPLVPKALPTLPGPALGREFLDRYQRKFGVYTNPNGQRDYSISIFTQVLDATMPPVESEIKAKQDEIAADVANTRTIWRDGKINNPEEVQKLTLDRQALVAEQMRNQKAVSHLIYADPDTVFEVNPRIAGNAIPDVNDIFMAQLTLWVQEQMARGIRDTNEAVHRANNSRNQGILASPIKRLVQMKVTHKFVPVRPVPGAEKPVLPSNPAAQITPNYLADPFGHVSNEFYDVVNFETTLIIDAGALSPTLIGLTRNRFFIFDKVEIQSMDSAIDAAAGFLYGKGAVVQVTIRGKYLFLREFLKNYMPVDIVRGVVTPAGAAAGNGQFGEPQY